MEVPRKVVYTSSSSSPSSCARSVADIGDHGFPTLSVVSSPDELIVASFFSCYEIIQTVCVFCALSSSAFGTTNLSTQYLFFLVQQHDLYAPKVVVLFFLMVLRRDLLYPVIFITSSIDFFSVHDILIILVMYHILCCFKSSF